jgi:hypothetical protein
LNCPKCKSENTQTLTVIYDGGTNVTQSTSKTSAGGFLNPIPSITAKTKSTEVTQTKLAQKATPPEKKKITIQVGVTILGILILLSSFGNKFDIGLFLFSIVLTGGFGYWSYIRMKYNKEEWPQKLETWEKSWYCHKCGGIFIPE